MSINCPSCTLTRVLRAILFKLNCFFVENFDEQHLSLFEDDRFINWVNKPDAATIAYWDAWMKEHPEQVSKLLQAKEMAEQLARASRPLQSEQFSNEIWENINAGIESGEKAFPITGSLHRRNWYGIAAAVIGLLLLVPFGYILINNSGKSAVSKQKIAGVVVNDKLQRVNSTSQNHIVYLVDGSKVTLMPGASVQHAVFLQKDKREIYLDGDAFFEVAKDANRPFYVYAHDIVLKVLGTSFNVTTNKANGNITVVVRTGKVSVYKSSNRDKAEYIVTPNQEIRYSAQDHSIVKSELDKKQIPFNIKPEAPVINFNFEDIPVAKIFTTLEEGYGIKINYDEKVFSKCIVTTSLTNEAFEEQLKVVCAATGAHYKIENNQVFVEGNGCR